jgi:Holliday junction resolvase
VKPEWRKSQQEMAKLLGCEEQPGGGSRPGYPGDGEGQFQAILLEHKYTRRDYIRLKVEWLDKITREAHGSGRSPVLGMQLGNAGRWVMAPTWWEVDLIESATIKQVDAASIILKGEDLRKMGSLLLIFRKVKDPRVNTWLIDSLD